MISRLDDKQRSEVSVKSNDFESLFDVGGHYSLKWNQLSKKGKER